MTRFVMPALLDGVEMVQETRGNDVALLGAARLVFEAIEDGRGEDEMGHAAAAA